MYNCIQYIWLSTALLDDASIACRFKASTLQGAMTPMLRRCGDPVLKPTRCLGRAGFGNEMAIAVIQIDIKKKGDPKSSKNAHWNFKCFFRTIVVLYIALWLYAVVLVNVCRQCKVNRLCGIEPLTRLQKECPTWGFMGETWNRKDVVSVD